MAKTAAERKAEQRKRQKATGETKFELMVDSQELEMVKKNCILRRPGKEPYDVSEYIQLLIRQDNERLQNQVAALEKKVCKKCGDKLPVTKCCLNGDSQCWATQGHNEFSLSMARLKMSCHVTK